MKNIKLSLSILLPGGTMYSKQECFKNPTVKDENAKNNLDLRKFNSFQIKLRDAKKVETHRIFVRKSKPAKQVLNLSEEAYNYFIGQEKPEKYRSELGPWNKLTKNQKITWHCNNIAENLGGTVESWEILD